MIIGIDLGTTNSVVTAFIDDKITIIPNALGEFLTPSAVSIDDDGKLLIGRSALERSITHPHLTATLFKRHMGTDYEYQLGKKTFRPEELSALVLKSLKDDAETFLGYSIQEAVISVPAYFNEQQRNATRNSGELAGLKVERLLNEPTAASIAFGLHNKEIETKILVLDLGGGTFDVSVLELFEGVIEVQATAGDNFLGGEDFTEELIEYHMVNHTPPLNTADLTPVEKQAILRKFEMAKRELTDHKSITFNCLIKKDKIEFNVSRHSFEQACTPLVSRLKTPIEQALRDSKFDPNELEDVLLVGGATRMDVINKMVARVFGRFPRKDVNPDLAVGIGAGIQGALKMNEQALDDVVLTDVTPFTLGISALQESPTGIPVEAFCPIIERNSAIPISRVETFSTVSSNQKVVLIQVFQGEYRSPNQNIKIGDLNVKLPKGTPAHHPVDVRFTYDVDGLLEVEVEVSGHDEKRRIVFENSPGRLSKKEISKRFKNLEKLKVHPRDQLRNRSLLAKGERLYAQKLGLVREEIGQAIDGFRSVLATQLDHDIRRAYNDLARFLDKIEKDEYRLE